MSDAYLWGLSRKEAADIIGLTDAQLKNFQQRYVIFPEKREGTGNPIRYDFRDIIKLAAFAQMMSDGFSAPEAADAVSPYTLYGSLFERATYSRYPGTFFVAKNHEGRWVGMDGPKVVSRYELRTWLLFDRVWPKFREVVLAADWQRLSVGEREQGLDEYFAEMMQRREELWR